MVDYEYWIKRELWTLVQASSLLAGTEPPENEHSFDRTKSGGIASEIYADLKDAIDLNSITWFEARTDFLQNRRVIPPDAVTWAHGKGYEIPEPLLPLLRQGEPILPSGTDHRKKWEIPGRLEHTAREIGEQWMKEQKKKPGVDKIAKHVEGVLKDKNLTGARGDYWDWQTIKKEALTGITGRKANGKK